MRGSMLLRTYETLLKEYGKQGWWPVTIVGNTVPEYSGGPKTDKQKLEVIIGAILTQNTSWKNVEKAIINLNKENLIDIRILNKISNEKLEEVIKPSGFFRQKSKTIKNVINFIIEGNWKITREGLLKLNGIGPETADSILLYALQKPEFVVDAYTKRIFNRLGLIKTENHEDIKRLFENNLQKDTKLYNEYHALIVEHAKRFCNKKPKCSECPLLEMCDFGKSNIN